MTQTLLSFATLFVLWIGGCGSVRAHSDVHSASHQYPFVIVLGVAQDAGYPQTACRKECCRPAWTDAQRRRHVACLGIVDPISNERWLIDATPDLREQLQMLDAVAPPNRDNSSQPGLSGIFLTHAHIGHYTGLQDLGREVTGAHSVPVYAMPRMRKFLSTNGPWSQLVELGNIELRVLEDDVALQLNKRITITPLRVPHRDEFSETVGYRIVGPSLSVLYIPDIDKWERWNRAIEDELSRVDIAFLDGTFYRNGEIPGRDMSDIPHPFIEETIHQLAELPLSERAKIRFIHLNHTNPALHPESSAATTTQAAGFQIAREGDVFTLQTAPHDNRH